MKFKIETIPNPLRQLDNIRLLRNILKPIKADETGKFLEELRRHPKAVMETIGRGFGESEEEHLQMVCTIYFNLPLVSNAQIDTKGRGSHLLGKNGDAPGVSLDDKKDLFKYLQAMDRIPSMIRPTKLVFEQCIGNAKSTLVYSIVD